MKKFIVFFVLILGFSLAGFASPQIANTSSNVTELWLGNSIEFSASCVSENNTVSSVWAILDQGGININYNNISNIYKATFTPVASGNYTGTIFCKDNSSSISNSSLTAFFVREFSVNILNPLVKVVKYPDDELEITSSIKKDSVAIVNGFTFEAYLSGTLQAITSQSFLNNSWILKIKIPSSYSGLYDLKLIGKYSESSLGNISKYDIKQNIIQIDNLLALSIDSIQSDKIKGGENIVLSTKAYYKGKILTNLTKDMFSINQDFKISEVAQSGDQYLIRVDLPAYSPGEYSIKLKLTHSGASVESSKKIVYPVIFTGSFVDSKLRPLDGSIIFTKGFDVSKYPISGQSTVQIPKGNYDMTVHLPGLDADFTGVSIENHTENLINFEYLDSVDLSSLKISAGFAMEFKQSFSSLELNVNYDDSKISDETNQQVYTCKNWNFGAKKCNSGWEEAKASFDIVANKVKINTDHLSAYVIGEKSNVSLTLKTDKDSYYLTEPVKVSGQIKDSLGNPLKDASITVTLDSKTELTKSDENGIYSVSILAPSKDSSYNIFVKAEKDIFSPLTLSKKLTIYKKKDATIISPQKIETTGKGVSTSISVLNSGQDSLSNLKLSISGLPSNWVVLEKNNIDSLGEKEKIDILLNITPANATTDSYDFSITLEGDSISKTQVSTLIITDVSIKVQEIIPQPSENHLTGMLTFDVTNTDTLLICGLVAIVVVVIVVAVKKKSRNRNDLLSLAKNFENEIDEKKKSKRR
ncbi:MAG: hypothetical protein HY831_03615 [Candidatus Aenigmarchaeota archaeon]|nr:hypothetical protein [Candidatus Aenigmarchaeota archaeon]